MCISVHITGKIRIVRDLFSSPHDHPGYLSLFSTGNESSASQPSSFGAVLWQRQGNCWWQLCYFLFSQILSSLRWGRHEAQCPQLRESHSSCSLAHLCVALPWIRHAMKQFSFTQRFLQECAHTWELEQENVHGLRPGWPDLEFWLVTVSQEWLPLWHCHVDLAWAQHPWVLTHPLWHSTGCSRFHSHIKQGNCSSFWSQPVWGGVEYQLSKDWRALSRDSSQTHSSSWDVWTELGGKHQNCSVQISRAGKWTFFSNSFSPLFSRRGKKEKK